MIRFTDYEGYRLRIMPTNFARVQTQFTAKPIQVVYANVTVLEPPMDLGNVAIFQNGVIAQIKNAWVGRPIVGTLVRRMTRMSRSGYVTDAYVLDDLEVE